MKSAKYINVDFLLATFHRLRTLIHLVTFLLTPSALLGLRAVCGGVTFLATVVTPVRLRAVVLHMALPRLSVS